MTEKEQPGTMGRRAFLGGLAVAGAAFAMPGTAWSSPVSMYCGRGIGDVTGEPLGAGMNGYAVLEQSSTGIHLRSRARAFVLGDSATGPRIVHVTAELGLMFESIFNEVVRRLQARYGNTYHKGNVLLTVTHTHCAPGGTDGHLLVDITTFGFRPATFEANVAGIVEAIVAAHDDYAPSAVSITRGTLTDAGVNRSHDAFDRDPAADKQQLPGGIDPNSVNLQITRNGSLVGVINWFATHGTSMPPTNTLISSDNKGYAALAWERSAGVDYTDRSKSPALVTAFAQSNPGDVTPNLALHEGTGPTDDPFVNTRIIGERQYRVARELSQQSGTSVTGAVDIRWKYVDMSSVQIRPEFTDDGKPHRTSPAMLGAAFAASSQEDGGGVPELNLQEGVRGGTPWVKALNGVVVPPNLAEVQAPKDILLPVGLVPGIVQQVLPFYLVRIGPMVLFSCGFEPTIVAGLRLRRRIATVLGIRQDQVIVQGYTNSYAHYMTTPEEYTAQDYEGGATVFGRWQLPAVEQIVTELAQAMRDGKPVDPGREEGDLTGKIPASPTGNFPIDLPAPGTAFGQLTAPVAATIGRGTQARASFSGANPNNDLRRNDTYLTVERRTGGGWTRVADDGDWDTKIYFDNAGPITGVRITWDVPQDAQTGTYRITYRGSSRAIGGTVTPFTGTSNEFAVT